MNAPFRLHALLAGDRRHPAVLFLHGFMGCAEDWIETIEQLADDYFCVAPDLPGHGKSTLRGKSDFSMSDTLDSIIALLDNLGLRTCHVVGYSMGGRIALHLAMAAPARCSTLTFISASPGIDDEKERSARRASDDALARQLELEDFNTFLDMWYGQELFASLTQAPRWRDVLARRRVNDKRNLAAALRGLGPARQESLWPRLASLPMPMLTVSGSLDAKYAVISERVVSLCRNARHIIVNGAGHSVHLECAHALASAIRNFISDHQ